MLLHLLFSFAAGAPPGGGGGLSWLFATLGSLLFLAPFVVGIAALLALFLFGRARRNALALFACGLFSLVNGAVWLAAFEASYYAKMDNAYLGNLIIGWWLIVLGMTLLIGSLVGFGVHPLIVLALWVVCLAGNLFGYWLGGPFAGPGGTAVMFFMAVVIGIAMLALLVRARWLSMGKGLLLGAVGLVPLLLLYGLGREQIVLLGYVGQDQGFYKPPYVDVPEVLGYVLLGVALFFVARAWSRPPQSTEPQIVGPAVPQT